MYVERIKHRPYHQDETNCSDDHGNRSDNQKEVLTLISIGRGSGRNISCVHTHAKSAGVYEKRKNSHAYMNSEPSIDFLGTKMAQVPSPDFNFLWIGSKADAADFDTLDRNGIMFIVNCTRDHLEGGVKNFHEGKPGMRYLRVPLKDNETEVCILLRSLYTFSRRCTFAFYRMHGSSWTERVKWGPEF